MAYFFSCLRPFFTHIFMFKVYIIYSLTLDRYYIGHSQDLDARIYCHKNSGSKSTKAANDWSLKYSEQFETRGQAMKRELEIKRKKSRKYIEFLIRSAG